MIDQGFYMDNHGHMYSVTYSNGLFYVTNWDADEPTYCTTELPNGFRLI